MPGSANGNIGLMSGWAPGDNGWDTGANTNWDALDALVQPTVKSTTLATPPASPANGDAYIVAASPTGAWAGKAGQIAVWNARGTGAWVFYMPKIGWVVNDPSHGILWCYSGSAWAPLVGGTATVNVTPGSPTLDVSGTSVSLTAGGTVNIPNASGLLVVNNFLSGSVGVWIMGGGYVTQIANANGWPGAVTYATPQYVFTAGAAAIHSFMLLRTRASP
ncbi:MAG: DUF2793 domain-containing protein [Burkholderiales bacterium]|nr:DUF2793 domain-containing protein [Burkholderiales bacterium]